MGIKFPPNVGSVSPRMCVSLCIALLLACIFYIFIRGETRLHSLAATEQTPQTILARNAVQNKRIARRGPCECRTLAQVPPGGGKAVGFLAGGYQRTSLPETGIWAEISSPDFSAAIISPLSTHISGCHGSFRALP